MDLRVAVELILAIILLLILGSMVSGINKAVNAIKAVGLELSMLNRLAHSMIDDGMKIQFCSDQEPIRVGLEPNLDSPLYIDLVSSLEVELNPVQLKPIELKPVQIKPVIVMRDI